MSYDYYKNIHGFGIQSLSSYPFTKVGSAPGVRIEAGLLEQLVFGGHVEELREDLGLDKQRIRLEIIIDAKTLPPEKARTLQELWTLLVQERQRQERLNSYVDELGAIEETKPSSPSAVPLKSFLESPLPFNQAPDAPPACPPFLKP